MPMTHTANYPVRSVGLVLTLLVVCVGGLLVSAGVAAGQTADFDPNKPYVGMEVTATDSQIQDGEFYDLRVVDEFTDGTVSSTTFVEELAAEGNQVTIETESLEPGEFYLLDGPGLDSPTTLTREETVELRKQTLDVRFGDEKPAEQPAETQPTTYYGNLTIDGEQAAAGTVVEAVLDGEVRGTATVDDTGQYGNASATNETLTVSPPETDNRTVSFYVELTDGDRLATNQSTTWEANTTHRIDLTVEHATDDSEINETETATTDSDEPVEPVDEPTEGVDDETEPETASTDDETPGFGVVTGLTALLGLLLRSMTRTASHS